MRSYTQAPSYQARLNERYFSPPNYLCIYTQLKKALLIVDRGSREPEVRLELEQICLLAKTRAGYDHVDYSFLEVLPPFIAEGIGQCMAVGASFITVMPYFLYPGMKLKDTVKQSAKIGRDKNLKLVITKPLSYHPMMVQLIIDRVNELKKSKGIVQLDKECDVVLIGHGSSDKNAHDAFVHAANAIMPYYRNVEFCFLGTLSLLQDKHPRDMVKLVKEVGADRCILSTDSFFDWVPPEPEIMRMAIANLLELGITKEEMRVMVQRNPAVLLGLEG